MIKLGMILVSSVQDGCLCDEQTESPLEFMSHFFTEYNTFNSASRGPFFFRQDLKIEFKGSLEK